MRNKEKASIADPARSHRIESLESRVLLAADLVISEFLASNNHSITDNFGDHSDWIEIHNRGDAAADLQDYYLTDTASQPMKWRFPTQQLTAGGYMLVYASDRNIAIAGQPLHTNFKLSADGEYLGLMKADGTAQFEYAPAFPSQSTDISYGMTSEDLPGSTFQYFNTPTPNAANAPSAVAPGFSVKGSTFSSTFQLTLSSPTPGVQIRYTTNRTSPSTASLLYTGPITITNTTVVRARAYANGYAASPVVSESYIAVDSTVQSFDTNVPIVVIDTFGTSLNDTSLISAAASFTDTGSSDGRADMLDAPNFDGRIGIRIRGQSSEDFPKKQFAIETWDENNDDKKVSLLGMPAESDWVLYAPYSEKSLMQNYLAMTWDAELGHYASRVRFVEVYLNTDGGTKINYNSDYVGVYILMEKIKISDDRVNIPELQPSDNAPPAITGGYIWKKDKADAGEVGFTTSSGQTYLNVEPAHDEITSAQQAYLTGYINQFESVLNGSNFADPVNGYAKYIDVDSWIDNWIMVESMRNIDGFRISTYFYKDRDGKIEMEPLWDYNLSMGNADYNNGNLTSGWDHDLFNNNDYPYFRRLFQDPNFQQKLVDRWEQLRKGPLSTANMMADIDAAVGILSDHNGNYPVGQFPSQASNNPIVRNYKRWNVLGTYVWPNGYFDPSGSWIGDVNWMKNFLTQREAWIDSQFVAQPTISPTGGQVIAPVNVTISSSLPSAQIYYTLDGSDPRASGGGLGASALLYTTGFTLTQTARISARVLSSGSWGGIAQQLYVFEPNTLRVTEIMYNPADPAGGSAFTAQDFEFVELQNIGDQVLHLGGYQFSEGITFTFPATELDPGAFIVIAKNLAAFQERYGSSATPIGVYTGSLDNGGETLTLTDGLGSTAQSFEYDDAWYPSTDGPGHSLEVLAPLDDPDLNLAASWHASNQIGGTPGAAPDLVPPTVTSKTFAYETGHSVRISFSEPIDLASVLVDDLLVQRIVGGVPQGAPIVASSVASGSGNTLTFNFALPFADGDYRASLAADSVSDLAGNSLAVGMSLDFFALAGDANHDRKVDIVDLGILATNWQASGKTFSQGDSNYDGVVNIVDLGILAGNWQKTLGAAPGSLRTASVGSASPALGAPMPAQPSAVFVQNSSKRHDLLEELV